MSPRNLLKSRRGTAKQKKLGTIGAGRPTGRTVAPPLFPCNECHLAAMLNFKAVEFDLFKSSPWKTYSRQNPKTDPTDGKTGGEWGGTPWDAAYCVPLLPLR